MDPSFDTVVRDTRTWLERAVIGLNLCPFAKAVHVKRQIHYAVSAACSSAEVLQDLAGELDALLASEPAQRETTLLIVPGCLSEFLEFNDVVTRADRLLRRRQLQGVIQLASFHPAYRFADSDEDDVANFTNRSPYPMLHLLREESVERAVGALPHAESIYEANIKTLRRLGLDGWRELGVGPST